MTKFMLNSRKKHKPRAKGINGGKEAEQVSSCKLLGVTILEDLSWSTHISATCLRSKHILGCMYRTFRLASTSCLDYLYRAVVRPVLEYALAVWSPSQALHQAHLERVQSFAAKVATKCWSVTSTLLL